MNSREREALDRHITGNYGEDQLKGKNDGSNDWPEPLPTKYNAPWHAIRTATRFELQDAEGFPVLRINGGMLPVATHAHLLAAAPEMFEALDVAVQGLIEHFGGEALEEFIDLRWAKVIVDKCESAIAKARGER